MITANYEAHGFRVLPNCHYDVVAPQAVGGPPFAQGNVVNFDFSACDTIYNAEFLGPQQYQQTGSFHARSVLWVDYGGAEFSLDSLFIALGGWTLTSSNGGYFEATTHGTGSSFAGHEWTGIEWLLFVNDGSTDYMAFADMEFRVPEAGSLPLVAVGLAGLCLIRRRTTGQSSAALRGQLLAQLTG